MTAPVTTVSVGFPTTTGFGNALQLDGLNIARNQLGTGTLGGTAFADLTSLVESVTITRGRNRQLDQFNAGTATVIFDNSSRVLDPLNQSSPYWQGVPYNTTGVLPRTPIVISSNGIPIYTGVVTDWNLEYDIQPNGDRMHAQCSDVFTVLANQALNAVTPARELSSDRVNTVLNYPEINYQGARSIGTGTSYLGPYAIAQDTEVLNYLQQVTTSEQGYLYVSAAGVLTFKGRSSVLNPIAGATFNTTGSGLPMQSIENQFGDELLYNYIITQSPAGAVQTTSSATSIAAFQTQQYAVTNLLNDTVTEVAALGNYLLGKYKDPVLRFTGISTELTALTETNQNICLTLDLTSIATVVMAYSTGTPATVSQTLIVSGISHSITPQSHIISYNFESTDGNQYLSLNNAIFGTLDNNLLSF
tara:strand:+ start:2370 stop:3623 length:1254 start_codon:yes stop_codon:yes gene_type:complete